MAQTPQTPREYRPGVPIDAAGGSTIDPTKNVLDLVEARGLTAAELRKADKEFIKLALKGIRKSGRADVRHILEFVALQAQHHMEMSKAESDRLNSIRQVDREEVAKTAVAASTAITTLASTTTTMADTLRKEVANTALAQENRTSAFATDVNKRLSAVELSLSEGKGKGSVSEPALERLAMVVEKLASQGSITTGKGEGFSSSWAILIGAVGMILSLIAIGSFLARSMTPATPVTQPPQVIYMQPSQAAPIGK